VHEAREREGRATRMRMVVMAPVFVVFPPLITLNWVSISIIIDSSKHEL
jgi:hypothetical protein